MRRYTDWLRLQTARYRALHAYRGGDWRKCPIVECGEPLVVVPETMAYPYYAREMGLTTDQTIYLREGVMQRVMIAQSQLAELGLQLVVYDGWRSIEVQEALFWQYLVDFAAKDFGLSEHFAGARGAAEVQGRLVELSPNLQATLKEANRRFVSWPSSDPNQPSPHATGGAVDVWLLRDGEMLSLGIPFDWMDEDAGAFYHLKNRKRFGREINVRRNALLVSMFRAGLSSYPPEIWHYNWGNQMHSLVTRRPARYSYIEP